MTSDLLQLKIDIISRKFNPSLLNKEILEFFGCDNKELLGNKIERYFFKDNKKGVDKVSIKNMKEKIRMVNKEIDDYMDQRRKNGDNPIIECRIEELLEQKKKLVSRVDIKKNCDTLSYERKKELAKLVPLTDFIEFNRMGFAKCLWHSEKTGSMKYYKKTNTAHCFGCNKTVDTIEVVKQLNNVNFIKAINIILNNSIV